MCNDIRYLVNQQSCEGKGHDARFALLKQLGETSYHHHATYARLVRLSRQRSPFPNEAKLIREKATRSARSRKAEGELTEVYEKILGAWR